MYCDVLIYLCGNSIGTDNDDDNGRWTAHFKSFYILERELSNPTLEIGLLVAVGILSRTEVAGTQEAREINTQL